MDYLVDKLINKKKTTIGIEKRKGDTDKLMDRNRKKTAGIETWKTNRQMSL